ncbi:MAG: AtpZ/AtpI family protein [Nitrospirota bacterium]|nr:AtpZ/AtpI family protein [Nitrospirota bacterium]
MNAPEKKPENEKANRGDLWRFVGVASTVGINMVVSTFVGFALGYWVIDRHFNTQPWFTVIFTLLGIFAGFKYLFEIAKKAGEKDNE